MSFYRIHSVGIWITLGVLALLGTIVGWSIASYVTAQDRGKIGVHYINNNPQNQISATYQWTTNYQDYQRDLNNLKAVEKLYANGDPQGFIISGQEACSTDVTAYNKLQADLLTKDWKPASLPLSLDITTCN